MSEAQSITPYYTATGNYYGGSRMYRNATMQRYMSVGMEKMTEMYHTMESEDIQRSNSKINDDVVEELSSLRYPIFPNRYTASGIALDLIKVNSKEDAFKVIGYCRDVAIKVGGKKNPNGPNDFRNAKNPYVMIEFAKDSTSILNAENGHTKDVDELVKAAILGKDHDLAALLLINMNKGLGVDDKTTKAILLDSKETMSEKDHARFIWQISECTKHFTGQSLKGLIFEQYSNLGLGHVPGLAKIIAMLGFNVLNDKGAKYYTLVNNALKNANDIQNMNGAMFGMMGMGMGMPY